MATAKLNVVALRDLSKPAAKQVGASALQFITTLNAAGISLEDKLRGIAQAMGAVQDQINAINSVLRNTTEAELNDVAIAAALGFLPVPISYPGAGVANSTGSAWGSSYVLDTDSTMAANSDVRLASQKATKTALGGKLGTTSGNSLQRADGSGGLIGASAAEVLGGFYTICRAFTSTPQSVGTGGSPTAIGLDSESWDSASVHDNVTNNSRFTVAVGTYRVNGQMTFVANAVGQRALIFRQGGSTEIGRVQYTNTGAGANTVIQGQATFAVPSGTDYVEVLAYQDSGSSLNVSVIMSLERIG